MLEPKDELRILLKQAPPIVAESDVIEVACENGKAVTVVQRLEELLRKVLSESVELAECSDEQEIYDRLAAQLPEWFPVAIRTEFDSEWEVADWLFWFLPNHSERVWRWHGIGTVRDDGFEILIGVNDRPLAWEALRVGIICSGGQDVVY